MAHHSMIMVRRMYLQIGFMTLLTSILWMSMGIYKSINTTTNAGVDSEMLAPLNTVIDEATLNKLIDRNEIRLKWCDNRRKYSLL